MGHLASICLPYADMEEGQACANAALLAGVVSQGIPPNLFAAV